MKISPSLFNIYTPQINQQKTNSYKYYSLSQANQDTVTFGAKNKIWIAGKNAIAKGEKNPITGWVHILSKKHDAENFQKNVKRLKELTPPAWRKQPFGAETYLEYGDFSIYFDNNEPQLGIRLLSNQIVEIQGEKNNGKIPPAYIDKVKRFIIDNNLGVHSYVRNEIRYAESLNSYISQVKDILQYDIARNDTKRILEYFNIYSIKLPDDKLMVDKYNKPGDFKFSDLGIDENKFFKKIEIIENCADFRDSDLTSTENLTKIGGSAFFEDSKITEIKNLKKICGDAHFSNSKITSLGSLQEIGYSADFDNSKEIDLANLKRIGGYASFHNSKITSLANLEEIGGYAEFSGSKITSLGKLKRIGESVSFSNTKITSLGDLEEIGEKVSFFNSKLTSTGKLKKIGSHATFKNSQITDLGNIEEIGGNLSLKDSNVISLNKLKKIGKNALFKDSKIQDLGDLLEIEGNADFRGTQIKSLGNLKRIGKDVFLNEYLTEKDFENIVVEGKIRK